VLPENLLSELAGPAALCLTGVSKRYPGVQALDDVSITVRPGEIHGLVGENGAGKSTLVNVLAGAVRHDQGTISVAGQDIGRMDPSTSARLGISVSHQEIRLAANLSVAENILFGSFPTHWGTVRRNDVRTLASAALAQVGADIDPEATVGDLSIGRQQMVEIARAVRLATSVLVLDEPTASLSAYDAEALFGAVANMRQRGIGVVYVSHRLDEVLRLCDRVTVLRDGRKVAELASSETSQGEVVRHMVGREVADMYPERRRHAGDVLLRTVDLTSKELPNGISLQVRAGEIVGIFGLVGAGRSEFVRLLAGVDPIRSGWVEIDGKALARNWPSGAMRKGIAFVPEDRKAEGLILDFTLAANLTLPSLNGVRRRHSLTRANIASLARERIQLLDIRPPDPNRVMGTLSGGNQQKTVIGKWLDGQPRLLIVDEPTRGVDVGAKAQIYQLLSHLAEEGMAILMVSSELPEVLGISDRVVVFHNRRMAAEIPAESATAEIVMRTALGIKDDAL
jgi:ribose transport system ATP-binding protein